MKTFLITFFVLISFGWTSKAAKREFYEIKIYTIHNVEQEKSLDNFLEKAYLPALHRMGIKNIGVFKPRLDTENAGKLIYVFTPLKAQNQLLAIQNKLEKDMVFKQEGKEFLDASFDKAPYDRVESIVLQAFTDNPFMSVPKLNGPKSERWYELRSYESATEKYYKNKVQMFNEGGEIKIFRKLNFNAVFYGEVISGSHMPNLMYMTTFENKADRDAHWKSFTEDPDWSALKVLPQYQKNVSKNVQFYLFPTDYSDL